MTQVTFVAQTVFGLFVCLFVCLGKTRKSILRSLCLEGSNNPWEWLHTDVRTVVQNLIRHGPRASIKEHCGAEFNQTQTTCINRWLTLYKLTGWLVSLDLRKPYTDASSTTELTTPYALLFCCRGKQIDKLNIGFCP